MSRPRQVIAGAFYLITRRCTQRQFLLRPDPETNNAFVYCLALAAKISSVQIICSVAESNHHHTVVYDPCGHVSRFIEHFHKLLARSQNALRGRWENFWSSEETCVTQLLDAQTVVDKVVYALTNPVKDLLVERVHHWPGVNTYRNLRTCTPLTAERPRHFFRASMPDVVELELSLPSELGNRDSLLAAIHVGIERVEQQTRESRLREGTRIVGRRTILNQDWRGAPASVENRRGLRPRFAGPDDLRTEAILRFRAFLIAYREARRLMLVRRPADFPVGTYWLRRFAAVSIAPA